jgi:hypothetical protein
MDKRVLCIAYKNLLPEGLTSFPTPNHQSTFFKSTEAQYVWCLLFPKVPNGCDMSVSAGSYPVLSIQKHGGGRCRLHLNMLKLLRN